FSVFRPKLERIVELTLKKADALREGRGGAEPLSRYDALLDLYEPDARTKDVADLFSAVREELVPLVRAVAERPDRVRGDLLVGDFDEDKQWDFGIEVLTAMGFDFDRGRQDRSEHPFTTGFTPDDVRLTTRFGRHLGIGLYGTMHEGGHGLYEQGIPGAWALTPIGTTASLGVHESQSRLWENVIGRSRHFWNHYLPRLKEYFPELAPVDLETFYRAVNESHPSLIRVDADELTYNLHIFLRFDLEQKLVAGDLAVGDLPEAWNEGMREYLGVTPPDHVQGVLQDVHWSGGMIGYFPTYALGNIMSLQLYEAALRERPSLPEEVARGELGGVLEWMRRNVHEKGATVTGVELLRQVTGTGFDPAPYLRYLKEKYTEIYGF
ncbi:MAG: carboxypeptidase M32, partial [Dactylosporangium sp.]|nr:carboxypeptidase M32 [Dactylosporangium sp.]